MANKPQPVPTLGIQLKTVAQCKICKSPHRGEIEDILTLQRRRDPMPNGIVPTGEWIINNAEKLWDMKLNQANTWNHFSKHFTPLEVGSVKPGDVKTENGDVLPVGGIRQQLKHLIKEKGLDNLRVAPEKMLEDIVSIAHQRILLDPSQVTPDLGIKAVNELTKRKHDQQTELAMSALVNVIDKQVNKIPDATVNEVVEFTEVIEVAEVVDHHDELIQELENYDDGYVD